MRTKTNEPLPRDELDEAAEHVMTRGPTPQRGTESEEAGNGRTQSMTPARRCGALEHGSCAHAAGGSTCERWVEIARDGLGEALGEPPSPSGVHVDRTIDELAHEVIGTLEQIPIIRHRIQHRRDNCGIRLG
jgi:hypothetical protein